MVKLTQTSVVLALSAGAALAATINPADIPAACVGQCAPLGSIVQDNPNCLEDPKCLCSANMTSALPACLQCVQTNAPALLGGVSADDTVKKYTSGCTAAGTDAGIATGTPTGTTTGTTTGTVTGATSASSQGTSSSAKSSGTKSATTAASASATESSPAPSNGATTLSSNMFTVAVAFAMGAFGLL